MNFGCGTPKDESFRIMDAALDAGINFFDTANNYGFFTGNMGITETIMGEWFAQGGGRRRKVVLSTKVHEDMADADDGPNTKPGLSIYKIRRHFEQSLKRLQTDHVEIYYMHHIDRSVQPEEAMSAFENLFERGLIDYIGASNFPAWQLARYLGYSENKKSLGIVIEQDKYNLMNRLPELELIPACEALGVGFAAWGPLNGGLLTQPIKDGNRRQKERREGQE
jgi:aryl-alcohol dehydrogenase-like predicted oxidoreductase